MKQILIIQTAFIGDVILATSLVEKLHRHHPGAAIDMLVRKGNEGLLKGHPLLREVMLWDKSSGKYRNLARLAAVLRQRRYDLLVNCQRFLATGALTLLSGAAQTAGFDKNPLSVGFTRRVKHEVGNGLHEVQRNHALIAAWTDNKPEKPRLYPAVADYHRTKPYKYGTYVTISPTSVWFTKQWPAEKWAELIHALPEHYHIYLLGGKADAPACEHLRQLAGRDTVQNLCGVLSFLESAALMADAHMNYVNDSGPLHIASAMNAPVRAVFLSTVPEFGFGPLSDDSAVAETDEVLDCRPCGLHGHRACPKGHFHCANIPVSKLLLS